MPVRETRTLRTRLPWLAVLVTLMIAIVLLLGPLWSSAEGENPLDRPSGVDWRAVQLLAMPTVMVLAAVLAALGGGRRWPVGLLGVLIFGYAVFVAPSPLPLWFAAAWLLTLGAFLWSAIGERADPDPDAV
ncbi:hypothetical protein ACQBAT_08140 [Ornithinimicrobium sp. Y1847]|uniref:hypothetical protein n=1 Tax=unclassified Ornithinimicrobium TaxID=2615080 RepID=UPI003B66D9FF